MATKKSPPEKAGKFTDLEPAEQASEPAPPTTPYPNVGQGPAKGTDVEIERQAAADAEVKRLLDHQRKLEAEAQARAAAFNAETRREEEAKAKAAAYNAMTDAMIAESKALALTIEELVESIDLALTNMAAGMTQTEAVRRAAETVRGEKVAAQLS